MMKVFDTISFVAYWFRTGRKMARSGLAQDVSIHVLSWRGRGGGAPVAMCDKMGPERESDCAC